jgi:hypothetical protein
MTNNIWHMIYDMWFMIGDTWYLIFDISYHISMWDIHSDILSDILSGIYSDILFGFLSGIYSDVLSGTLSDIYLIFHSDILPSLWHSLWHDFGSRRPPQHPALAIWSSVQAPFTASWTRDRVRVQAPSTASGARYIDIVYLREEVVRRRGEGKRRRRRRRRREGRSCTCVKL